MSHPVPAADRPAVRAAVLGAVAAGHSRQSDVTLATGLPKWTTGRVLRRLLSLRAVRVRRDHLGHVHYRTP